MEKWKALNSEAMEYHRKSDLAMTEKKFMEAVKEAEKFGPEDIRLSECLDNVIWIYHTRGKVDEAEAMIRQSLSIQEKIYGPDNEYISWNLSLLVDICQDQGKLGEAKKLKNRAEKIDNAKALSTSDEN
jgi:tetratricopeptide (TPR) repeat protein